MALSYPLSLPSDPVPSRISYGADSVVGVTRSPFDKSEQIFAWDGDCWGPWRLDYPPLTDAQAQDWIALLLGLNGIEGSLLMGDAGYSGKRGTWAYGSPTATINGAHAAGVKTVAIKDMLSGATAKAGDYIQFGSGSGSRLHRVVQDAAASGAGALSIEIWPRLRAALADGDAFVVDSPVGVWRLADNRRSWSVGEAKNYGLSFSVVEDLRL